MRRLKLPSLFLNQPSNAPVTLAPMSRDGSSGNCCCATNGTQKAQEIRRNKVRSWGVRSLQFPVPFVFRLFIIACGLRFPLGSFSLVVLITHVRDIHPGMTHFIHRAITETDPLIRIRVVLVG